MKARTMGLTGLLAAGALLMSACGSQGTTAGVTSMPVATSAGAGPASGSASATTAGTSSSSSAAQLDGTTISWFTTLCAGITSLGNLQGAQSASSAAELGTLLSTTGDTVNQTAASLGSKAAPTFEGGQQFATQAQKALGTLGSTLTEFGQRASALQPGDTAAAQQFATDFQAAGKDFNSLGAGVTLDPAIEQAVAQQVPGCDVLAATATAGKSSTSGSTAGPTS